MPFGREKWVCWGVLGRQLAVVWAGHFHNLSKIHQSVHCSFSISCFLLSELFFRSVSFLFSFYFSLEVAGVSLLIKNATDIAVIAVMTMTQVNELLCCDGCCFSLCYLCIFLLQKFADPVNKILLLSIIQLRQLSTYNMLLLLRPPLCRCVWVFNLSLDFPVLQPVRH